MKAFHGFIFSILSSLESKGGKLDEAGIAYILSKFDRIIYRSYFKTKELAYDEKK